VIQERKKELERESLVPTETQQNNEDSLIGLKGIKYFQTVCKTWNLNLYLCCQCVDKKRAFLDLMLIAAKEGANLSDLDIRNEVDTLMFEVLILMIE